LDRLGNINFLPNNDKKPTQVSVDLSAYYNVRLTGGENLRFTLSVYNLLDRLNETYVNGNTGRAYTAIIREQNLLSHHSDFNEYIDRVHSPGAYSTPRYVKLGMGVSF
jgi:outer membrane receptor protein involved in Fe transport